MQVYFSSYFLCLFNLRSFLMKLPNLTYFGHDGSYFFNDYRRTKHHPMIKQTAPESLDYQEKVAAPNRIIDYMSHSQQTT